MARSLSLLDGLFFDTHPHKLSRLRDCFQTVFTFSRKVIDGTPVEYQVNQVYKVLDNSGNEVTAADSDASDNEITTIVKSQGK